MYNYYKKSIVCKGKFNSIAANIQKQTEEQITEKNMDAEPEKIEKEIRADSAKQ